MEPRIVNLLAYPTVVAALNAAWLDSGPGLSGGHEEGGFVLRDKSGTITVRRWLRGTNDEIIVPAHPHCQYAGCDIVATFHTHPNTGDDYEQSPSVLDRSNIRKDHALKGDDFVGEFVISDAVIYLIDPRGTVQELGSRRQLLAVQE